MTGQTAKYAASATNDADAGLLKTHTVLLDGSDVEAKRREILAYFHKTFAIYEELFDTLADDEAFFLRPEPLRHPLIFYYGHTAVFWINKLNVAGIIAERIDAKLESMLAIGVDEMSWDDLDEKNYDWPSPDEVRAYRQKMRDVVDHAIRETDFTLPIGWDSPMWIVMMGIEHERIHLETTSVIIRRLPVEHLRPNPLFAICPQGASRPEGAPENELLPVKGGPAVLGKDRKDPVYGWDNEYGRSETRVDDYRASKYLVSNAEFFEFVQDGGYVAPEYWTQEGRDWLDYTKTRHPVFWVPDGDGYKYRAMLEVIDMPWDWPVDINYLEAKAFCNWKSEKTGAHIRMPTEAEWRMLRALAPEDQPTWDEAPGNINLEHFASACPVDMFEFDGGFCDIVGNVWQWSETPIDAFDGYEVHPVYDDFSAPTFDGLHNMILGGCFISTGNYAIRDSRYGFRRHFYQHAGLRYVEGGALPEQTVIPCETRADIATRIEFDYGAENPLGVPNFPVAAVGAALARAGDTGTQRALDIGCGAGRSSFELARNFEHVDALEFTARLLQTPINLQNRGTQRYTVPAEGELVAYREVDLDSFDGYATVKDKISFMQADASNLVGKYADYDFVFASNLIERLYDPVNFLRTIRTRIRPGGVLAIASTYLYDPEVTRPEKRLGGFKADTGESFTSLDGMAQILSPEFTLTSEPVDIQFAKHRTARVFDHGIAQLTVWKKRT